MKNKHKLAEYLAKNIEVYDDDFLLITQIYDCLVEFEKNKDHIKRD